MAVALEEPRENDKRLDVDGVPVAVPPDTEMMIKTFGNALIDNDAAWHSGMWFMVTLGNGTCNC